MSLLKRCRIAYTTLSGILASVFIFVPSIQNCHKEYEKAPIVTMGAKNQIKHPSFKH